MALDLSSTALDLSSKRPISISEQINGVAHFSFAIDKVAKCALNKESNEIDVEAWDDSLWNVKSVIALAEILEDWKSDEEESGPWRCNYSVIENPADTMGHGISVQGVDGDSDLDSWDNGDNAIADSSDFFVFSDPIIITPEPLSENAAIKVTETASNYSLDCELRGEEASVPSAEVSELLPASQDTEISSLVATCSKRTFDQTLLDCWSNDNLEYGNDGSKRWRFDIHDELDSDYENLHVDIQPCDEIMEVSDCEEGSDIVELPVVEEFEEGSDNSSIVEDCRSILYDSDLQLFPLESEEGLQLFPLESEEGLEESVPGIEFIVTSPSVKEASDESDIYKLPITSLKSDNSEVLEKIDLKVEPNNNEDDFLGNLLIDLP